MTNQPIITHTLPMWGGRVAWLYIPADVTRGDFDLMRRSFDVIGESLCQKVPDISVLRPQSRSGGGATGEEESIDSDEG